MDGEGATDRARQGYEDTRRSGFEEKEAKVNREQTVFTFVDVRHGKVQGIRQLVPDDRDRSHGRKRPSESRLTHTLATRLRFAIGRQTTDDAGQRPSRTSTGRKEGKLAESTNESHPAGGTTYRRRPLRPCLASYRWPQSANLSRWSLTCSHHHVAAVSSVGRIQILPSGSLAMITR